MNTLLFKKMMNLTFVILYFKGPITWRISARAEISAHLNGLKIQPSILIKLLLTELRFRAKISHIIYFKFQSGLKHCLLGKKIRIKTKKKEKSQQSSRVDESFEKNMKLR